MFRTIRTALAVVLLSLPLRAQQLELRFLDVGQGDAIVIREGGKTALVDSGRSANIMVQLQALGIDTIDLLVASHNHADHIGGMAAILSNTGVRYYLDNGLPHTTATYQRTIQAVAESGAQYLRASDRTITLGSAQLRVLTPPPNRDQNNSSVGLLVQYGEFRALLTGDSELTELRYWLNSEIVPRVQVVKVAHHGSWNGTTAEWVDTTRPEVAVISVGAMNSYGHPSPRVIQQWQSVGARVHRTDLEGTISIFANRDGTFLETAARSDAWRIAKVPRLDANGSLSSYVPDTTSSACCKICAVGKACGNSCINGGYICRRPAGCACDARQ
jgi:competence protein ComEC